MILDCVWSVNIGFGLVKLPRAVASMAMDVVARCEQLFLAPWLQLYIMYYVLYWSSGSSGHCYGYVNIGSWYC